jgi:hypothetical protein
MFVFRGVQNRKFCPQRPGVERMRSTGKQGLVTPGLRVASRAQRNGFTAARKTNAIQPINVFTVEEYESNGKTGKKWTKIGAAFPHKEGLGFSIELKAFPIDGRLVVVPPDRRRQWPRPQIVSRFKNLAPARAPF